MYHETQAIADESMFAGFTGIIKPKGLGRVVGVWDHHRSGLWILPWLPRIPVVVLQRASFSYKMRWWSLIMMLKVKWAIVSPSLRSCFHENSTLVLAANTSALLHILLICNCLHACGFMDKEFTGYNVWFHAAGLPCDDLCTSWWRQWSLECSL